MSQCFKELNAIVFKELNVMVFKEWNFVILLSEMIVVFIHTCKVRDSCCCHCWKVRTFSIVGFCHVVVRVLWST